MLRQLIASNTQGVNTTLNDTGLPECKLRLALWEVADCLDRQFCQQ